MATRWGALSAIGSILVGWALIGCRSQAELSTGEIPTSINPTETLASSPALLDEGKRTYAKQCLPCHGSAGDGQGEAAYLLYPKPRDFTLGEYRLVSTWDGIPTDEDLYRTISRGMPGSAMPSWAHLSERTRWGLVHYIKSFSKRPLDIRQAKNPANPGEEGEGIVQIPPEPAPTPAAAERAREIYLKGCAPCHGPTGRGDGRQEQQDSKGLPTRPRDLTAGVFKGSPEPEQVYRRLVAGLPGSPMPMNPYLHGEDAWHLTRYVLSLSSPEQRGKVEMKTMRLVARRVEELPTHPDSSIWHAAEAANVHLMPLWWRPERPEEIAVKAVHDGKELALLLVWQDSSYDHTAIRPQDFRDAAAVQFSLTSDPPFIAMGQLGAACNIWMWKSERQADLEPAFQDLDKIYPHLGIDSYPNFLRSPLEQPTRHALTLDSDPTYVTAWGAGNIVADPTRGSSVESLRAEGFGTLRAQSPVDQKVHGVGIYATGSYRVMFRRLLDAGGEDSVLLQAGRKVPVAFAVWNGSAGDRDGKKSVTIWQELHIAP
jgi:mono/diheme cytochrome c family protein